jgi:hypothetical protein
MAMDLTVAMIGATVQIDQPLANGGYEFGTGFLIQDPAPDGTPRIVLVTAGHVFDNMPGAAVDIGYRFQGPDGAWKLQRQSVMVRDQGRPLWIRSPTQDVAVMAIQAPPEFAKAAIPEAWLADDTTFDRSGVRPGDEVEVLGFPNGLASNDAGFPLLRIGRVASYPLTPITRYQSFVIDFRFAGGNSGGPVFVASDGRGRPGSPDPATAFVAGILTKQVEKVELGIVVHAFYIRQTLSLLDVPGAPQAPPAAP